MSHPNPLVDHCVCDHAMSTDTNLEIIKRELPYADIDTCEECGTPIIWSCCNIELDPYGDGICPNCKEHCL